jgi:hypothetical protein
MVQPSLFEGDGEAEPKPADDRPRTLRLLIVVTAAPQPSETHGETVCVAGIRLDVERLGWVRLYPINLRHLGNERKFRKYDIVTVDAVPSRRDPRYESWRPRLDSLRVHDSLPPWQARRPHVEPLARQSMCEVLNAVRADPPANSLAAVRPRAVTDFVVRPHPGWTPDEQRKIDRYVNELDLFGELRSALEAPRFKAWYRYRCASVRCRGHEQGLLDWEFVALQRRLAGMDDATAVAALRTRFLTEMCGSGREVTFFVGNQAKRQHTFSVLGVFYPPRVSASRTTLR